MATQRHYIALALLMSLSMFACSKSAMVQMFAPADDQALVRTYIDQVRHRQFDAIEAALDPSLAGAGTEQTLEHMAALFPAGEPTSLTLVGAQSFSGPEWSTINLTYEFGFAGKWLLTNVALKKQHGKSTIVGFHVYPQPASLEAQNRFSLAGKSALQYAVLACGVVVPLFTLWVFIVCLRTKLKGRRWPWLVFILVGFGKLAVNWTTGAWAFALAYVQLLGASAVAPPYGPWTIAVSFPLGAIVFLLRRKALRWSDTAQSTIIGGAPDG